MIGLDTDCFPRLSTKASKTVFFKRKFQIWNIMTVRKYKVAQMLWQHLFSMSCYVAFASTNCVQIN